MFGLEFSEFESIKAFCRGFVNPVILFNKKWEIVYCNKKNFLAPDISLQDLTMGDEEKLKSHHCFLMTINGRQYCSRISLHGDLYLCELFSSDDFLEIADKTGIYEKMLPFINNFEHNIAVMWNSISSLNKKFESEGRFDDIKQLSDIQRSAMYLNASGKNIFEFANMFYPKATMKKIDAYALVEGIINRCNIILEGCCRRIEFYADKNDYFIRANQRHCVTALINALQNALLYSPVDSCPTVTLSKSVFTDVPYAILQVTSKCSVRTDENGKAPDLNFSCQRIGCGIPIIKRFTEESGGEFSMEEKNGIMTVTLKLPIIVNEKCGEMVLEESEYTYYDTGIPDIVALKMFEVLAFFGVN